MPRKRTAVSDKPPHFKSEAEEADWYHTPEGRQYISRKTAAARKRGVITVEARSPEARRAALAEAKRTGKFVRFVNGTEIQPTDPAVLQQIKDRVEAKQTVAISLRISQQDLDIARQLADKAGIGYQTLLKDIIHEGLTR